MTPGGQRAVATILLAARIWQAAPPPAARNMQPAAEPARTPQRHRSPDQRDPSLNVTGPAARIRPEELT